MASEMSSLEGLFGPEPTAALAQYAERADFRAGDLIFGEGTESDCFYVIQQGEVRLEVRVPEVDSDGVLAFSGEGSLLGEVGVLAGTPRSASAYAHTDVVLVRVTSAALERVSEERPRDGLAVMRALGRDAAHKLLHSSRRVAEHVAAEAKDPVIDRMALQAVAAQRDFMAWDEERVDNLLQDVAKTVNRHAEELATATVAETRLGNSGDKAMKIQFASLGVYGALAGHPGSGPLHDDQRRKTTDIASPVGVVFALLPITSPVATLVNKVLICLKGRNALIASSHRGARLVTQRAADIVNDVLERHGAPAGLVQVVTHRSSRQTTARLMRHPAVSMILATGGRDMVTAAYSAGKPAIGVGPGNAPAWICADADLEEAARFIVESKAFDNGLVCGAEQHLVVDRPILQPFMDALAANGAAVLTEAESDRFTAAAFEPNGDLRMRLVGRSASELAAIAGLERAGGSRLLVFLAPSAEPGGAVARERLAPVVSLFVVDSEEQALTLCRDLLAYDGAGHTAVIHSTKQDRVERFAAEIPASRILVNVPASLGCCGVLTGLEPSFTLGCGTLGGNSTTDNIGYRHLLNIKRVARLQYGNMVRMRRVANDRSPPSGPA